MKLTRRQLNNILSNVLLHESDNNPTQADAEIVVLANLPNAPARAGCEEADYTSEASIPSPGDSVFNKWINFEGQAGCDYAKWIMINNKSLSVQYQAAEQQDYKWTPSEYKLVAASISEELIHNQIDDKTGGGFKAKAGKKGLNIWIKDNPGVKLLRRTKDGKKIIKIQHSLFDSLNIDITDAIIASNRSGIKLNFNYDYDLTVNVNIPTIGTHSEQSASSGTGSYTLRNKQIKDMFNDIANNGHHMLRVELSDDIAAYMQVGLVSYN